MRSGRRPVPAVDRFIERLLKEAATQRPHLEGKRGRKR
jgi:hypothetical protein